MLVVVDFIERRVNSVDLYNDYRLLLLLLVHLMMMMMRYMDIIMMLSSRRWLPTSLLGSLMCVRVFSSRRPNHHCIFVTCFDHVVPETVV